MLKDQDTRRHSTIDSQPKKKVEQEKKLTETEAMKYRGKLVEYILWQSEHLDKFIIATTKGHDPNIEIWGDIDQDTAEILADYLINQAKVSPPIAKVVREMVTLLDKIKVAVIVTPRMYRTGMLYLERGFSLR